MREPFDPADFERALEHVPFARIVVATAETRSTNDDAIAMARTGAPQGTVVVADTQTAGRGRRGRGWWAEPGSALLVSWVVRPATPVDEWRILPLVAGVAVAEGIERATGLAAGLKWPNDLVAGERKLGGILAEADPAAGFAVIGLGLNTGSGHFPDSIAATATSIGSAGGRPASRPAILAEILRAFGERLADPDAVLEAIRARLGTLGRRVRVERAGMDPVEGLARDLDRLGGLLVETAAGTEHVTTGDVVHLRDA